MPPIRNKWLFVVSMGLAVVVLGFVVERLAFLAGAERTVGQVSGVSSENGSCGRKRSRRSCTRYYADVEYVVRDNTYTVNVPAGKTTGRNQPLSYADYEAGDPVPVVYSRGRPFKAYRDSLYDIWGTPLMWFFSQLATLAGAFSERRRTA